MSALLLLLIILGGGALVVWGIYQASRFSLPEFPLGRWNNYFPNLQCSTKDFYESVEALLKERQVPGVELYQVEFSERGMSTWGQYRKYLRVKNGAYTFDICAAPYGTGLFVSWWYGESIGCLMYALFYVPFLGAYLRKKLSTKTYYILDMEATFRRATHSAVLYVIDSLSTEKGVRLMSDYEREPETRPYANLRR